jgi:methionine transaminase
MSELISKLPAGGTSIFSIISQLADQHEAINLGQGFPSFDCPQELKDLSNHYLQSGKNQYCPMPGLLKLRKVLSEKMEMLYQADIDPESQITITAGATQAIFCSIMALVHPGDEVIIIEPAYDSYKPTILLAGGIPVIYELQAPGYKVDWGAFAQLVTAKTKMIIINTPQNPIGKTLKKEDLLALQEVVLTNDLYLLSDEVYEHLVYDDQLHESALKYPALFKKTICVYSFGKTFHNTGWKMGYCVAPAAIMAAFRDIHQWNVFSVNSFLQFALADFLKNQDHYLSLSKFYQEKRDAFNQALAGSNLKALNCEGTYFQLFDYSQISDLDNLAFSKKLIMDHGVASIPVSSFYTKTNDAKVIRLCFAKTPEILSAAAKKLKTL